MKSQLTKFALIGALSLALGGPAWAVQKDTNTKGNPPAASQTKTSNAAMHRARGTIASIDANKLVLDKKLRGGKTKQVTIMLNPDTKRMGNLTAGNHVSVRYREENNQKIATTVREMGAKSASKHTKSGSKPAVKS